MQELSKYSAYNPKVAFKNKGMTKSYMVVYNPKVKYSILKQ